MMTSPPRVRNGAVGGWNEITNTRPSGRTVNLMYHPRPRPSRQP